MDDVKKHFIVDSVLDGDSATMRHFHADLRNNLRVIVGTRVTWSPGNCIDARRFSPDLVDGRQRTERVDHIREAPLSIGRSDASFLRWEGDVGWET